MAVVGGLDAQPDREVGLAGAGRAEQDDVAGLGQEPPTGQRGDLVPDGGLSVEVEVVESFAGAEPGVPDPLVRAGGVTGRHLPFQDGGQVVLERPAGIPSLVGQPAGGLQDPGRLQRTG